MTTRKPARATVQNQLFVNQRIAAVTKREAIDRTRLAIAHIPDAGRRTEQNLIDHTVAENIPDHRLIAIGPEWETDGVPITAEAHVPRSRGRTEQTGVAHLA